MIKNKWIKELVDKEIEEWEKDNGDRVMKWKGVWLTKKDLDNIKNKRSESSISLFEKLGGKI